MRISSFFILFAAHILFLGVLNATDNIKKTSFIDIFSSNVERVFSHHEKINVLKDIRSKYQSDSDFKMAINLLENSNFYKKIDTPFSFMKGKIVKSPDFNSILQFLASSASNNNHYAGYLGLYILFFTVEQTYPTSKEAKKAHLYKSVILKYYPTFINSLIKKNECVGYLHALRFYRNYLQDMKQAYLFYQKGKNICNDKNVPEIIKRGFFLEGERISYIYNRSKQ